MNLNEILDQARAFGGTVQVTINIPVHSDDGQVTQPSDPSPAQERPTIRTVMWALNRLQAAPGQPNRDLVRKFLFMRGWLGGAEEVENWNLDHVPTSKPELALLVSQITQFEKDNKKTPAP